MLISLAVAVITGILLKSMPGMWLGISHGVSGFVLVICAAVHCIQHGKLPQNHTQLK
ncbi:MAG: hypothetical protein ACI4DV_03945 [Lachnospiraceae bacterium]